MLVFRRFRNTARVARNAVSEEIVAIEGGEGTTFADVAHLASGERGRREVLRGGDMDAGMWWAGQSQGLIADVPTCAELIPGSSTKRRTHLGEAPAMTMSLPA